MEPRNWGGGGGGGLSLTFGDLHSGSMPNLPSPFVNAFNFEILRDSEPPDFHHNAIIIITAFFVLIAL